MAKVITLALPLPQSQNLNQILGTQLNRKSINIILSSWSWTRTLSSIFCNSKSINRKGNINDVLVRGIPSVSATSLPCLPNSHLPLRSSCDCLGFPCFSLLPLRRSRSSSLRFSVMSSQSDELGSTVPQDSAKTIRCVIKGRVQGVFYRNWTIENATQLGLKGWVRNRRDGSVEALFSGKAEVVDEMVQRCRRGPPDAMVTALESSPSKEDPGAAFERKPTV